MATTHHCSRTRSPGVTRIACWGVASKVASQTGQMIRIARVYDLPKKVDGWRVLVDRLWPRGLRKQSTEIDEWMKEIGPSNELRKWFGHKPERWSEFKKRYGAELRSKAELLDDL